MKSAYSFVTDYKVKQFVGSSWSLQSLRAEGALQLQYYILSPVFRLNTNIIGIRLAALTRQGKIRRIKRNGTYAYTVPLGEKTNGD